MYFRGIAADSKFQEKMKGYLFSEGYLFTGYYGNPAEFFLIIQHKDIEHTQIA